MPKSPESNEIIKISVRVYKRDYEKLRSIAQTDPEISLNQLFRKAIHQFVNHILKLEEIELKNTTSTIEISEEELAQFASGELEK